MAIFEEGVFAKVKSTGRIGIVDSRARTKVTLAFSDQSMMRPDSATYQDYELIKVNLSRLKRSQLCPLVRGELTVSEVTNGTNLIPESVEVDRKVYRITAEDLLAGLNVYDGQSAEDIYAWLYFLYNFNGELSFVSEMRDKITDEVTEQDLLPFIYDEIEELYWWMYFDAPEAVTSLDFKCLREMLEVWVKSEGREYPDEIKYQIIYQYDEGTIDQQSEKTQKLFKACLDYLCDEKKEPKAIQTRGYCYYTGTKVYPNDWVKARDSFLVYYAMTGDASAANTLGYIYYYGRCNGGVPEYDEAFRYFSIGHAYTYFESTYKLADMFAHGYGVVQDGETANHLYRTVYEQTVKRFVAGDMECKFADAALRMGNCYRDGIGVGEDFETAYYYYLQADYAIRKRVECANHYGDQVVYAGVQKALSEVRAAYTDCGRTTKFEYPVWIKWVLQGYRRCKMSIKGLKHGVFALDVSPMKRYDDEDLPAMLITIPKADYCELRKKVRIKTAQDSRFEVLSGQHEIIFDHIEYDWNEGKTSFFYFEELVGELNTDYYAFTAPAKKKAIPSGEKYHFVAIRFGESGRSYDYLCEDETVSVGDWVVVNGYDGETTVEVVDVFDQYESELGLPIDRYKHVIRKA